VIRDRQWTSQAESLPDHPDSLTIEVGVKARVVYLLFNGGATYNFSPFVGAQAAEISLEFASGDVESLQIVVGRELRDWECKNRTSVVCSTDSPLVRQAWSDNDPAQPHFVDMLTIEVPVRLQGKALDRVVIRDVSVTAIGSRAPAFFQMIAMTVR